MARTHRSAGESFARGLAACVLGLAGCTAIGPAPDPSLDMLDAISAPGAASDARTDIIAIEPALTQRAVPPEWWRLFGDATLTALQAEAAASNLEIRTAAVRIEESRAQLGLIDAARWPQLSAHAGLTRSRPSEHSPLALLGAPVEASSTWLLGLQAVWELDLAGYLHHLNESAQARLAASAYGMAAVKVSIAARIAHAYLRLRGVQAQMAIEAESQRVAGNLLRMAESRQRNGVATRLDVASARAEATVIASRLWQLEQQSGVLMNALARLLGKPPRELNARLGRAGLPPMPRHLPVGIPSKWARKRPDILQAEARLHAALADIGAAKADFYPRVSLTGNLGVRALEASDLGSWGSHHYSIGPTLYLPLFQGGRLERNLALTEARHQLAAIAYQRIVLRAWHEVDDALGGYTIQRRRETLLQRALAQSQAALVAAQRAYQRGAADFTTVLVAQRSVLARQSELNQCTTASALSIVALYRALGGGWPARAGTASARPPEVL